MRDFRELKVWQASHALCLDIYRVTRSFPGDERFGLTSQCRRAAASIPANIAEGCGRGGERELARFLEIAAGSASELEYHCMLAKDLGFLPTTDHTALDRSVNQVKKMLNAFIKRLKPDGRKPIANS